MSTSFHAEGGDTRLWLAVDGRGANFEEVKQRWASSFAADGHDLYPWGLELRPIWEVVERIDAAKGQALREHLTLKWQRQARAFRPVNFYTQIPRAVEITGARKRSWGELNGIYTRVAGKLCNGKAVYQASTGEFSLYQATGTSEWWVGSGVASCEPKGFIYTWGLVCDARPDCAGRWMESEGGAWGDAHGLVVRKAQCAGVCGAHGTLVANAATCECSCRDGFSGPRCELAPAYSINGAAKRSWGELNGIYTQVAGKLCNGKPVYQTSAGDYFLFQPTDSSRWWVSDGEDAAPCKASGWIYSPLNVCAASPEACAGRWQVSTGDAPGLAVREAQCADVCGPLGSVANADTCECSCRDGFSGPRCEVSEELPPAYSVSGAAKRSWGELNGIYTLVAGKLCSGKPVYQKITGDYVLFHPTDYSGWVVGPGERAVDCHGSGYIDSDSPTDVCGASPEACAGRWRESTGCDSDWCDAPGLAVQEAQCADVCGAHGSVANAATCECSCIDGFSGPRCELAPAYLLSGAAKRRSEELNGIYTLVPGQFCNGKPVYQTSTGNHVLFHHYVLFQPIGYSGWVVGHSERAVDCQGSGYIMSEVNVCAASPDECDGQWQESNTGCDSVLCDAPELVVGPADAEAVAAAEEAASWRRTVAIVIAALAVILHWLGCFVLVLKGKDGWWIKIGSWALIIFAFNAISGSIRYLYAGVAVWTLLALWALNFFGAFLTIGWLGDTRARWQARSRSAGTPSADGDYVPFRRLCCVASWCLLLPIAAAGCIAPLVELTRRGPCGLKEAAASVLGCLAATKADSKVAIAKAGGIAPLVALVCDGTDMQKLWAAIALWNLADNDDNKVAIAEAGGIAPLIALARGGTDGQKGSAAGALRRLASNDDSQVAIAEAGGIAPLVALVRSGTDGQQKEQAAGALRRLALNADNKVAIAKSGGIAPLVALARAGTDGQKEQAAAALVNLATNTTIKAAVEEAGWECRLL